jgi:hypothetical protein
MIITDEIRDTLVMSTSLIAGGLSTNGGSPAEVAKYAGSIAIAIYLDQRFEVGAELPAAAGGGQ